MSEDDYNRGFCDGEEANIELNLNYGNISKRLEKVEVRVREGIYKKLETWLAKEFQKIEEIEDSIPENAYYKDGINTGNRETLEKLQEFIEESFLVKTEVKKE